MKKIVLFGDSIFNGFRNHHNTELITQLFQNSLGNNFEIINISKSGATTVEGLDYLKQVPQADLIVIEYGSNDASSAWGISQENYACNLQKMIDHFGKNKCIIVGPLPTDPNNFAITQFYAYLAEFNKTACHLAQKNQIPFIDMTQVFKNLPNISSYYQKDGQHLTDKGNNLLVKTITPIILSKLKD